MAGNRSTFTKGNNYEVDVFDYLYSLPPELASNASELQTLMQTTNKTSDQITRQNQLLTELKSYYINPDTFNKFIDCITNMEQNFIDIYNDFQTYTNNKETELTNAQNQFLININKFQDKADYNSSTIYDKWNTITYNSETYMSLIDNNLNNRPDITTTAWRRIARRGMQGIKGDDGVGLVPKGIYNDSLQYIVSDLVSYENSLYYCTVQPSPSTKPTNSSYWQLLISGIGTVLMTTSNVEPNTPYVGQIWRKTSDIVYAENKEITTATTEPTIIINGGIWRKVLN